MNLCRGTKCHYLLKVDLVLNYCPYNHTLRRLSAPPLASQPWTVRTPAERFMSTVVFSGITRVVMLRRQPAASLHSTLFTYMKQYVSRSEIRFMLHIKYWRWAAVNVCVSCWCGSSVLFGLRSFSAVMTKHSHLLLKNHQRHQKNRNYHQSFGAENIQKLFQRVKGAVHPKQSKIQSWSPLKPADWESGEVSLKHQTTGCKWLTVCDLGVLETSITSDEP